MKSLSSSSGMIEFAALDCVGLYLLLVCMGQA